MRVTITGEKPPETIAQSPAFWMGAVLAFSPDGKRIAYVATPESQISIPVLVPSASKPNLLKVVALDSGTTLNQFDWPASAGDPRWAPGGEAIDYELTRNGVSNICNRIWLAVRRGRLRILSRDRFSTLNGRVMASSWH
jgi:hypothetical protein